MPDGPISPVRQGFQTPESELPLRFWVKFGFVFVGIGLLFFAIWQMGLKTAEWDSALTLEAAQEHANPAFSASKLLSEIAKGARALGPMAPPIKDIVEISYKLPLRISTEEQQTPKFRLRYGHVLNEFAEILGALGEYDMSSALAEQGRYLIEKLPPSMLAQNDAKRELSLSHQWIGIAHKARGEFAEASIAFENSMDIRKQLIEADSGNLQFKRDLVIIKYEVADNLLGLGRKAEAILAMQEAIAVGERLDRWNPNASVWEADRPLLKTMASLVGIDQGPPSDAITTNNDALSMLRAWTGKYSNDNVIGSRLLDLELRLVCKSILIEEERPTDALAICQGGIQVARALVGKEPENSEWQDKLFLFQVALSKVLQINEDFGGAFSAARKAHGITTELLERDPTNSRWQQNFAYVNDILGSLLGPI